MLSMWIVFTVLLAITGFYVFLSIYILCRFMADQLPRPRLRREKTSRVLVSKQA